MPSNKMIDEAMFYMLDGVKIWMTQEEIDARQAEELAWTIERDRKSEDQIVGLVSLAFMRRIMRKQKELLSVEPEVLAALGAYSASFEANLRSVLSHRVPTELGKLTLSAMIMAIPLPEAFDADKIEIRDIALSLVDEFFGVQ